MAMPNGVYIVQGEISLVITAMRRTSRYTSHGRHQDDDGDQLLSSFSQLKDVLNNITELDELEANVFLSPFLEVIRSEDTTGPITGLALSSVNKFLSYNLIDPACETAGPAIENIADAVTHARFVGTDPSSDEVILMKILHVLRTLLLCPAGVLLTNESVCEIMQSCFRICFEMRLSELLRKSAENTLMDMVQLLFTRLPQFKEDPKWSANMKKLKMRTGGVDQSRISKRKRSPKPRSKRTQQPPAAQAQTQAHDTAKPTVPITVPEITETEAPALAVSPEGFEDLTCERLATTPAGGEGEGVVDITKSFQVASLEESARAASEGEITSPEGGQLDSGQFDAGHLQERRESGEPGSQLTLAVPGQDGLKKVGSEAELGSEADRTSCTSEVGDDNDSINSADTSSTHEGEFVNPKGVRFLQHQQQQPTREGIPLIPYGLPCVRELFRFLISLTNPFDRHNTDVMIHMGLSLLTVALETGADHISYYNSLLYLVKDELCRSLSMLLQSERLSLFAAALRVSFLLFESMRSHLKFQLEMYLTRLSEIVVSESPKITYDQREIALESIVQLWRIPGLVTELYLNYDCDLYCSNLFEELTKLLSKNAFPVSGLFTTHLLSLDALLTVVDSIEQHCHRRILAGTKSAPAAEGDTSQAEGAASGSESESRVDSSGAAEPPVIGFRGPPTTGFSMAQYLLQKQEDPGRIVRKEQRLGPQIKPNRLAKLTTRIPTHEELMELKQKKKAYIQGTELFNQKPAKGITFLQEQGLLSTPLDPGEVVTFLRENPKLDKKMIGEYIGSKKNKVVLEAFVKSFNFEDMRIDEALRLYLETFRLPGEAPVISYIMEHFAEHWHKSNGELFFNTDAAFTLAYAVIMLNVDQHNHNVKKQSIPMTMEQFKNNVSKVNGGKDFDEEMLEEIFTSIRNEEIVMPSEHTGLIRENYIWKLLLRRGATKEGVFLHAPTGAFDSELFTLIWGPTVAALSFVFDKSTDESIIQKAVSGFRKCAMISAHNNMSDVFDNLVISLCKFTTLLSSAESPESIPVTFGSNFKAQLAARTVFGLAHRHGDILREGWKNILDCLLQLFRARLLPKSMIEVEDFADPSGKVSIVREETTAVTRSESGVLSTFASYFSLTGDSGSTKGPTAEELEASRQAQSCVQDCHLDSLIADTKFLRHDSLSELVKALIAACQGVEEQGTLGGQYDEDAGVFFLELLVKVVLQNRDRVTGIWTAVRDHLLWVFMRSRESGLLVERAVVGLLRMAIRLLRREEMASQVLAALRMLLVLPGPVLHSLARQVTYGLHELLRTNAANIHTAHDWHTLFSLLEVAGAGANPPPFLQVPGDVDMSQVLHDAGAQSDSEVGPDGGITSTSASDRGYTSDSELYESATRHQHHRSSPELALRPVPDNGSWMLVNHEETVFHSAVPVNQYSIELREELVRVDRRALMKAAETLAFLVRDAAHVTPHNFQSCVHAIRIFVEASVNGGHHRSPARANSLREPRGGGRAHKAPPRPHQLRDSKMKKSKSSPTQLTATSTSDDEGEEEAALTSLHSLSIQLLDLMHTLHTRAASIFAAWAQEERQNTEGNAGAGEQPVDAATGTLWATCWCPLLQGIARLCCDTRRQVRSQALTYLQRALLVHDLQTLSAVEWEACFNKVLFPLLTKLLENINPQDLSGMEETRMRASTLLSKVFLQHLSPLLGLSTFTALWLTILDFMEKYMKADSSDLLSEAIPENLKNMLLVMETASIFRTEIGAESQLWRLTWDKIDTFLPHLKEEIFKPFEPEPKKIDRCENVEEAHTGEGGEPAQPASDPSSAEAHQLHGASTSDVPLEGITVVPVNSQAPPQQTEALRPASPLLNQPKDTPPGASYILHPPLPSVTSPGAPAVASSSGIGLPGVHIPLLLNPDILQSTTIPYISPQKTLEMADSHTADTSR